MQFKKWLEALKFPGPAPTNYPTNMVSTPEKFNPADEGEAEIDISSAHVGVLAELGIRRRGRFYRGVKDYAAVEDFLKTGVVKQQDGSAPMYAPDAYPMYIFKSGFETGYVFEIEPPDGHLAAPTHAGLDPTKRNLYKQAAAPTAREHVTRVIELKRQPTAVKGRYVVSWRVVWKG